MTEVDEAALEAEFDSDRRSKRALGSILSSTRTEQMHRYGDWGRYEMGCRIQEFQRAPLTGPPEPKGVRNSFDDRIARRYVLARVLELGLDVASEDIPPGSWRHSRQRPPIERLGKKYQWIAFHEFLGYLTDHYHFCESIYEDAKPYGSALDFGLPDLLDPVLRPLKQAATREGWDFTEVHPWWVTVPEPYPCALGERERNAIVASPEVFAPDALLRPGGTKGEWLALTGDWEWQEKVPCWVEGGTYNCAHAGLEWFASSYAVPVSALDDFVRRMRVPVIGAGMKEDRPTLREEMSALVSFPLDAAELELDCLNTFSKVPGAWFAAADYSTHSEADGFHGGVIPSPQLAKLAGLRWTHDRLDFSTGSPPRSVFQGLREGGHHATMINAELLKRVLAASGLRLCWRLYGWKWCNDSSGSSPMREYWALYTLGDDGLPTCVGGGTWLAKYEAVEEQLPW